MLPEGSLPITTIKSIYLLEILMGMDLVSAFLAFVTAVDNEDSE